MSFSGMRPVCCTFLSVTSNKFSFSIKIRELKAMYILYVTWVIDSPRIAERSIRVLHSNGLLYTKLKHVSLFVTTV